MLNWILNPTKKECFAILYIAKLKNTIKLQNVLRNTTELHNVLKSTLFYSSLYWKAVFWNIFIEYKDELVKNETIFSVFQWES